jgi:hypothetical protein
MAKYLKEPIDMSVKRVETRMFGESSGSLVRSGTEIVEFICSKVHLQQFQPSLTSLAHCVELPSLFTKIVIPYIR